MDKTKYIFYLWCFHSAFGLAVSSSWLVSVVAHSCHCSVGLIAPLFSIQHISQDILPCGFPEFLFFGTVKTFLNVSGNFSPLSLSKDTGLSFFVGNY